MRSLSLVFDYIRWHYTRAFVHAVGVWSNFVWFTVHFFSMPLLFRTLLSPWRRMSEAYHGGGFEDALGTLIVNVMTRIVGFIVRLIILLFGTVALYIVVLCLVLWLIVWVLSPILMGLTFAYGIFLLTL